jgi:hypothetical protein
LRNARQRIHDPLGEHLERHRGTVPRGRVPALKARKAPRPMVFGIASAMMLRAEFPVQMKRTL